MKKTYDDIINLPHHVSSVHPQMPMRDRAAQFAPFAALTGYDDAVKETARQTGEKVELSEDGMALLNEKLYYIVQHIQNQPKAKVMFFQPDTKKDGGEYIVLQGNIRKIDEVEKTIVFSNGLVILLENVMEIEIV